MIFLFKYKSFEFCNLMAICYTYIPPSSCIHFRKDVNIIDHL